MLGAVLAQREVRKTFSAINRQDVETLIAGWHEDGVFEFPGDTIMSGRFHGREAIRAWFERWFSNIPVIRFTLRHVSVENIFAFSGTNVLHVEWDVEETDREGHVYHMTGVTAFDIVGGKARMVKDYIFDQDVLASIWPRKSPVVGDRPAA